MPFTPSDVVMLFINNSSQTWCLLLKIYQFLNYISIVISELWHLRNDSETRLLIFLSNLKNPIISWGPCLHKGKKKSLCKKQIFLFISCILQCISVQSLQSLPAVALFQPDFCRLSKLKHLELPGWISKMKTSSECMLTEGPQSLVGFIVLLQTPLPKTISYRSPTIHSS